MPAPSKSVVADRLAQFKDAAREFGALANELHARSGTARTHIERARVVALLDRAKILEGGLRSMTQTLAGAKSLAMNFWDDRDIPRLVKNSMFRSMTDSTLAGAIRALQWFNTDARALLDAMKGGTLDALPHPAMVGLKRAAPLALGLAVYAAKKGMLTSIFNKVMRELRR